MSFWRAAPGGGEQLTQKPPEAEPPGKGHRFTLCFVSQRQRNAGARRGRSPLKPALRLRPSPPGPYAGCTPTPGKGPRRSRGGRFTARRRTLPLPVQAALGPGAARSSPAYLFSNTLTRPAAASRDRPGSRRFGRLGSFPAPRRTSARRGSGLPGPCGPHRPRQADRRPGAPARTERETGGPGSSQRASGGEGEPAFREGRGEPGTAHVERQLLLQGRGRTTGLPQTRGETLRPFSRRSLGLARCGTTAALPPCATAAMEAPSGAPPPAQAQCPLLGGEVPALASRCRALRVSAVALAGADEVAPGGGAGRERPGPAWFGLEMVSVAPRRLPPSRRER